MKIYHLNHIKMICCMYEFCRMLHVFVARCSSCFLHHKVLLFSAIGHFEIHEICLSIYKSHIYVISIILVCIVFKHPYFDNSVNVFPIFSLQSTESDFSWESDDLTTTTKVSFAEFVQQYKELTDWLNQIQLVTQRQSSSLSEKYLNQVSRRLFLYIFSLFLPYVCVFLIFSCWTMCGNSLIMLMAVLTVKYSHL